MNMTNTMPRLLYVGMKYDYGDRKRGLSYEYRNFQHSLQSYCAKRKWDFHHYDFMDRCHAVGQENMTQELYDLVKKKSPTCLFAVLYDFHRDPFHQVFKAISDLGTTTIHWFCDDHWRFEKYTSVIAPNFDFVCTTAQSALPKYNAIGIGNHVIKSQWACNHELYTPYDIAKNIDVSFIGQPHGDRVATLTGLEHNGIHVETFGFGWPHRPRLPFNQMVRLFSRSKINLNLSNSSTLSGQQIKGRNFEVPGTRSFLLTGNAEDLNNYFNEGKEIVIFESEEDLSEKIKYYLKHDEERERIAVKGYGRTIAEHTWHNRFSEIFSAAGIHKQRKHGVQIQAETYENTALVSVIIPCYNYAQYLTACVESVLAQSYKAFEIIIVNDGSTDQTQEIADSIIKRNSSRSIRLINQANSGTPAISRNNGISQAAGKYILCLDADDMIHPHMLQKAVQLLESRPEVSIAYSDVLVFGAENTHIWYTKEWDLKTLLEENIPPYCSLYRREVWQTVGGYNPHIGYEDWDFWISSAEKGFHGEKIKETLFQYRDQKSGRCANDRRRDSEIKAQIALNHPALYDSNTLKSAKEFLKAHGQVAAYAATIDDLSVASDGTVSPRFMEQGKDYQRQCLISPSPYGIALPEHHKRVLIACSHFWPSVGGLEVCVEQLGSALIKKGYDVTVMTPACPGRESNFRSGIRIDSVDPVGQIEGISAWPFVIRKSVLSGKYDACILMQDPLGEIIWSVEGITLPGGTRLIIQPVINCDGYRKWKEHADFRNRLAAILKQASAVVAMTKAGPDTKFMQSYGIVSAYIPNATTVPKPAGDFRKKYAIGEERFLVLHVANLYWVKNHMGLLDALEEIPESWQLVMVGKPTGEPECARAVHEKLAARPDVLFIPGLSREWISAAMKAADVVVLSSFGEGSPITILEAMAHGKPWLATPQCGAANDHLGGVICGLSEFKSFLAAFDKDPQLRKSLGELGNLHWKEGYSWEKVVEGWTDLIETGQTRKHFTLQDSLAKRGKAVVKRAKEAAGAIASRHSQYADYVNIGMVTYNRLDFTRQAIEGLQHFTNYPHVITVVDNCSTDGTADYLKDLKARGIVKNLLLLEENVGVAKASNLAWMQEPTAQYYLKLDNDIVIQKPGWLSSMVETLDRIPQLGAVAYNFEPASYPLSTMNGCRVRIKPHGNLGGACILIPQRTQEKLGFWCEDYGLYSEEDYDYSFRIRLAGLQIAYMEDEEVGIHLPAGRAAVIEAQSYRARDGIEEETDPVYRKWKDDNRRRVISSGTVQQNLASYKSGKRPLYVESSFVQEWKGKVQWNDRKAPSKAKERHLLKILAISREPKDSSCALLRIIGPLTARQGAVDMTWVGLGQSVNVDAISRADLIAIQRGLPRPEDSRLLDYVFASGKPVVYDLDDLLTDLPATNPHRPEYERCRESIRDVLRRASAVIVSSNALAAAFGQYNRNLFVLPNLIDETLWKTPLREPRSHVVIGYAGTPTHGVDLEVVAEALEKISTKYGTRVSFRFLGCTTERISALPGFSFIRFTTGYEPYVRALREAEIDIALAPLSDNPFNRCKSNIKWLEYSACGIAGVYANLPPYASCIDHGTTGLLASNDPDSWFRAISKLIDAPDFRADIARQAQETVLAHYSVSNKAHLFLETYRQIVDSGSAARPQPAKATAEAGPDVSIVIPVFNQVSYTRKCLESLYATVSGNIRIEIIIVDNASSDETPQFLSQAAKIYPGLKIMKNRQNLGFAKACNLGAKTASGQYLLFLNNDTEPQPGWLESAIEHFCTDKDVGIVGSRLIYPEGTIQHAGIEFKRMDHPEFGYWPVHRHRHLPRDHSLVSHCTEVQAVTGACLFIPRELFCKLGGFSEEYKMYFEDLDLNLKVRAEGKKILYEPSSVVIHHEGKSSAGQETIDQLNLNAARIFFRKWTSFIKDLLEGDSSSPDRGDVAKKDAAPLFLPEGDKASILWAAPIFDPSGYADEARHLIQEVARRRPVRVQPLCRTSEKFAAGMNADERDRLTSLMNTPICDSYIRLVHAPAYAFRRDSQALRNIGRTVFETDRIPSEWVKCCNEMDEVWVPTEFNAETFRGAGVDVPILVVPEGVDDQFFRPGVTPLTIPGRRSYAFLSIFEWTYRKGWDVLLRAWAEAFKPEDDVCLILRTYPINVTDVEVKAEIEHRIAQYLERELHLSIRDVAPIIVLGEQVPQRDIPALYTAADTFVLPSRGEGWGRPYIEAMACGLPVIGTRWGGNVAFMNDENSYLLDSNGLVDVDTRMEFSFYHGHRWADPSARHLVELMRRVFEHPSEAVARGLRARRDVVEKWTWEIAGGVALRCLNAIDARQQKRAPVKSVVETQPFGVRWEGSQFVHHSLALVNRELCLQFIDAGYDLSIIPYEPHQFGCEADSRFALLESRFGKYLSKQSVIHVRHQWPPNFNPPPDGHWVIIQPWEFGRLPAAWVGPMSTLVDEIWVPSRHVLKTYISSGIPADRVQVVPNGVNTQVFHPGSDPYSLRTDKSFKFLFVGGTIWRKGIDLLLQAYANSFEAADDVVLVIKDIGQDSFYWSQGAGESIRRLQSDPKAPEILYLSEMLNEHQMPGLFAACDCLVHPYRGEGFGLPILEAMACGLPVLMTEGGAADDFCPHELCFGIPASRREINVQGTQVVGGVGWVLEPDLEELKRLLRYVYENREEAAEKAKHAMEYVHANYTWEKAARRAMQRMGAIVARPIRREQSLDSVISGQRLTR